MSWCIGQIAISRNVVAPKNTGPSSGMFQGHKAYIFWYSNIKRENEIPQNSLIEVNSYFYPVTWLKAITKAPKHRKFRKAKQKFCREEKNACEVFTWEE